MTKKPTVSQLKKKADKLFSLYIRNRDNGVCFTCGVQKPIAEMQAGHFVTRAVNKLRYDEMNVHCQCFSCNVMKHGDQFNYAKQLDLKYGDGTADELYAQRFDTHKFTTQELENIIKEHLENTS